MIVGIGVAEWYGGGGSIVRDERDVVNVMGRCEDGGCTCNVSEWGGWVGSKRGEQECVGDGGSGV